LFFGRGQWQALPPAAPAALPPRAARMQLLFWQYRGGSSGAFALQPVAAFHVSLFTAAVTAVLGNVAAVRCPWRAWAHVRGAGGVHAVPAVV